MTKKHTTFLIAGILMIVLLGIMTLVFGNVGVRRVRPNTEVTMTVNEPIVPGTPVVIRWSYGPSVINRPIYLYVRDAGGEYPLSQSNMHDGLVTAIFPCAARGSRGGLYMADRVTGELIVWQEVAVLPPGRDCL